jgi:hypothetical protein
VGRLCTAGCYVAQRIRDGEGDKDTVGRRSVRLSQVQHNLREEGKGLAGRGRTRTRDVYHDGLSNSLFVALAYMHAYMCE